MHNTPEALLLVGPGCPHCGAVRQGLETLVADGTLRRLEVVDVAASPAVASDLGVRSVPWARIGTFELAGLHSLEELRHWARLAGQADGLRLHLADLLASGRRDQVLSRIQREPDLVALLAELIGDPHSELSVRIGVMATLEELGERQVLAHHASLFAPLAKHPDNRVRADACEALTLTGGPEAMASLKACLADPDPVVREIAADGIEALETSG